MEGLQAGGLQHRPETATDPIAGAFGPLSPPIVHGLGYLIYSAACQLARCLLAGILFRKVRSRLLPVPATHWLGRGSFHAQQDAVLQIFGAGVFGMGRLADPLTCWCNATPTAKNVQLRW